MKLGNLIVIAGCLPQLTLNFYFQFIGKFIVGFGASLVIYAVYVFTAETLPGPKISLCLTAVSVGMSAGFFVSAILQSFTLPAPSSLNYPTSGNWRICFMAPAITAGINLLQLFQIKNDSIMNSLSLLNYDNALTLLKRVYIFNDEKHAVVVRRNMY